MSKKTVIVGASTNPSRYAYLAAQMLTEYGHEIVPVGIKEGSVMGKDILPLQKKPAIDHVDTVTLYIGPQNQIEWYEYILSLKPRRIIFNPGTENSTLELLATKSNIEPLQACTLVLLRSGQY